MAEMNTAGVANYFAKKAQCLLRDTVAALVGEHLAPVSIRPSRAVCAAALHQSGRERRLPLLDDASRLPSWTTHQPGSFVVLNGDFSDSALPDVVDQYDVVDLHRVPLRETLFRVDRAGTLHEFFRISANKWRYIGYENDYWNGLYLSWLLNRVHPSHAHFINRRYAGSPSVQPVVFASEPVRPQPVSTDEVELTAVPAGLPFDVAW